MKPIYVKYKMQKYQAVNAFTFCPFCRAELVPVENGRRMRPTCPACGFVHFTNPAPAVSVLVVHEGNVLLGRRTGTPGAGKWALSSGYIEYDEDFLTAARREVKEETGLDVHLQAVIHVESAFLSPQYHFLTIYLLAEVVGGRLVAGDDFTAVQWFPVGGPLPEMAFLQDVALVERASQAQLAALPLDPALAILRPE